MVTNQIERPPNTGVLVEYQVAKGRPVVNFAVGQPLGYLSSWPLFTLSHHLVVQYCAELVYPGRYFDRYAILGDDVCIADERVASKYHQIVSDFGVDISIPKSLVSNTGGAEFAKRFRCHNMTKDLSPVSVRNLLNSHHIPGLYSVLNLYPIKRFSTFCRLYGIGYRTLSRLNHTQSPKVLRLRAIWDKRNLPLEIWLGRGRPLNPYLRGFLIDRLRKAYKPTDLKTLLTSMKMSVSRYCLRLL